MKASLLAHRPYRRLHRCGHAPTSPFARSTAMPALAP